MFLLPGHCSFPNVIVLFVLTGTKTYHHTTECINKAWRKSFFFVCCKWCSLKCYKSKTITTENRKVNDDGMFCLDILSIGNIGLQVFFFKVPTHVDWNCDVCDVANYQYSTIFNDHVDDSDDFWNKRTKWVLFVSTVPFGFEFIFKWPYMYWWFFGKSTAEPAVFLLRIIFRGSQTKRNRRFFLSLFLKCRKHISRVLFVKVTARPRIAVCSQCIQNIYILYMHATIAHILLYKFCCGCVRACIYVWRRTLSKSSETPVPRRAAAAAAAAFDSPHRPPLLWNTKETECYTFVCVCVSTNSPISEEVK